VVRLRPVPLYANNYPIGVAIFQDGVLTDPDNKIVTLQVLQQSSNTVIVPSGTLATYQSTGLYQYLLGNSQTTVPGINQITWSWTASGMPITFVDYYYQANNTMYYYSALTEDQRNTVVSIAHRIDRSFDSSYGGPYLQDLPQSGMNLYEDIAMIWTDEVMDYVNYEFQPIFNPAWGVGVNAIAQIPQQYQGVVNSQVYAHLLKHIARNYIEQPMPENMTGVWNNRRDYYQRWWSLYEFDKEIADKQLRQVKRWYLVGSKRAMLVAGGLIPRIFQNPSLGTASYGTANLGGF
jgi:hypothetical protein